MVQSQKTNEALISQIERERAEVVRVAREWLRTPYHHFAAVKGSGADCAMLLKGVYEEAIPDLHVAVEFYPEQWHLHENVERFKSVIESYCAPIIDDIIVEGDIVLCFFGKVYSHGMIVVEREGPVCVHASMRDRAVVLVDASRDAHLKRCKMIGYRPKRWGVNV